MKIQKQIGVKTESEMMVMLLTVIYNCFPWKALTFVTIVGK